MSAAPLLEVRRLVVSPPGRPQAAVLRGVDLEIAPRGVAALVGESGSGKTTLARAVAGLLPPGLRVSGGEIRLAGPAPALFYCPANAGASFNPARRIGGQLGEGGDRLAAAAGRWLWRLGCRDLRRMWRAFPRELSGGEAQRALLALALARRPRLLILDEPGTGLDEGARDALAGLLEEVGAAASVWVLSHDLRLVKRLARCVHVMAHGEVVEHGPAETVFGAPRHPHTAALLRCAGLQP